MLSIETIICVFSTIYLMIGIFMALITHLHTGDVKWWEWPLYGLLWLPVITYFIVFDKIKKLK